MQRLTNSYNKKANTKIGRKEIMNKITYDQLLHIFIEGKNIDETTFYFEDDPNEYEHYIGYLPKYEKPYWAGYCDIENGTEYLTALELFTAPIYDEASIKDRYNKIVLLTIGGICVDEWVEMFI